MSNDDLIGRILRGQGPILGRITGTGTGMRKQNISDQMALPMLMNTMREVEAIYNEPPEHIEAVLLSGYISRAHGAGRYTVLLSWDQAKDILARTDIGYLDKLIVWTNRRIYFLNYIEERPFIDHLPRNPEPLL